MTSKYKPADSKKMLNRLAELKSKEWNWMEEGSCKTADKSLFFYDDEERGTEKAAKIKAAINICKTCPVVTQCRTFAIETEQPYGIWGGLTESELYSIRRRLNRGKKNQDPEGA